jgi:large subunit ribosomal protein L3
MPIGLLGKKLGMTQIFSKESGVIPITVIRAGPCVVVQKKQQDGYHALQIGFEDVKRVSKPLEGHFKRAGVEPKRFLREFIISEDDDHYEVGEVLKVDIFKEGDFVDITGISKGKGFAGVMKRWGFRGGKASHGSMFHRAPGSIGASADPSRVFKGSKLPGRMGGKRTTIQNLEIIKVDLSRNLLLVKGATPGRKDTLLIIQKAKKKR